MAGQKKEVLLSSIRIPKPGIVCAGNAYAWECEHKKLGIRVLGDSKAEAVEKFKSALDFEVNEIDSVWLDMKVINDLDPRPINQTRL